MTCKKPYESALMEVIILSKLDIICSSEELDDTTDTIGTDEITTPEETLYPWDPN